MASTVFPAASGGPTTSEIATAVAAQVSPYGGTITNIGYTSAVGLTTYTWTGLSSYKFLCLDWHSLSNAVQGDWWIRFNGDTSSKYVQWERNFRADANIITPYTERTNKINMRGMRNDYTDINGRIEIFNTNSTVIKNWKTNATWNNTAAVHYRDAEGFYYDTTPISSMTVMVANGVGFTNVNTDGGFYLWAAA